MREREKVSKTRFSDMTSFKKKRSSRKKSSRKTGEATETAIT